MMSALATFVIFFTQSKCSPSETKIIIFTQGR